MEIEYYQEIWNIKKKNLKAFQNSRYFQNSILFVSVYINLKSLMINWFNVY